MDDRYYDEIAPGYDALHGQEQDAKLQALLEGVSVPRNATVLDVGCGTGRSAAFFDDARWHGVEPSAGMIAQAPADIRFRIMHAKGEALLFPEASFDLVLSLTALQNYDDPQRGVQELVRVCKRGGALLISVLRKSPKIAELDAYIHQYCTVIESREFAQDVLYICSRAA